MVTAASSFMQAKPGCPAKCGNVSIPYPFGIFDAAGGEGCSINRGWIGYGITCNTSFDPPKPFLGKGSLQVLSISESEIRVRNKQVAGRCFTESGVLVGETISNNYSSNEISYSLERSPFTFSYTKNRLFAIGCDTITTFQGYVVDRNKKETKYEGMCTSSCGSKEEIVERSCSERHGCCELTIPKRINWFGANVFTLNNHTKVWSFNNCSYAILAEQDQYMFRASDFLLPSTDFIAKESNLSLVLNWAIGNKTCEEAQKDLACKENSNCINSDNNEGYRCTCYEGYEGNPYLSPGCQDMNECADQNNNPCKGICTNTIGSYSCSCPEGSLGDGRKDGRGCYTRKSVLLTVSLGIGLGLLFLIVGGSWLYFFITRREQMKLKAKFFKQNGGLLLQQNVPSDEGGVESTKIYTAKELEIATNNYDKSRVLGEGGYGTVYKGILSDNREVAIKKSKIFDQTQIEQFINEVVILTRINHRNVVKLLGCCLETEVPLLVYEYVSSGTLYEHIHCSRSELSFISWKNRLRIATETADAIAYLHSAASTPIVHRDIKSANILLDENYTAKVSDFGASRLIPLDQTQLTTLVQGTLGYLDPEYFFTSQLTEKSDVYSFGVILAELLTAEKPLSFERSEEQRNLATYFILSMATKTDIVRILEAQVLREGKFEDILACAEIAKRCLALKSEERPTMKQVVAELEDLRRSTSNEKNTKPTPPVPQPTDLYGVSDFDSGQFSSNTSTLLYMNLPR
ncbi:wall-associated receptor kinase 2-like [Papaver somniferum]|uniref:wall-associated receptor kinase 2-like n=1 Tax=Papaver somniferum TaxID=3469 RepID=UPI000E6F5D41|nr:wall-associated receptor kinase 2-like [Papaver somniferum]